MPNIENREGRRCRRAGIEELSSRVSDRVSACPPELPHRPADPDAERTLKIINRENIATGNSDTGRERYPIVKFRGMFNFPRRGSLLAGCRCRARQRFRRTPVPVCPRQSSSRNFYLLFRVVNYQEPSLFFPFAKLQAAQAYRPGGHSRVVADSLRQRPSLHIILAPGTTFRPSRSLPVPLHTLFHPRPTPSPRQLQLFHFLLCAFNLARVINEISGLRYILCPVVSPSPCLGSIPGATLLPPSHRPTLATALEEIKLSRGSWLQVNEALQKVISF